MFRRNNRSFFSSVSRNARRASKAIVRANRNNAQWMKRYEERQDRFARWKHAFTFIPMNISRFVGYVSAFFTMLAEAINSNPSFKTKPSRIATNRDGILGKRKRRGHNAVRNRSGQKTDMSSKTYDVMEPRQMLATLSIVANDNAAAEPGTNSGDNGQFTVLIDTPAGPGGEFVSYTVGGTATEGVDYNDIPEGAATGNTVVIPEGQTSAVIDINVIDDFILEGTETIEVTVSTLSGPMTATTTISDNEVAAGLEAVITASNNANTEDTDTGSFTIELVGAADGASVPVTVDYAISGAAVVGAGGDHDLMATGSVTFAPGVTSQTVTFTPDNDGLVEATENVRMELTGITATGLLAPATVSFDDTPVDAFILDDDTGVIDSVTITPPSENPPGGGATNGDVTFAITTGDPSSGPTVFSYNVTGTALPGVDYTFGPIVEAESNNSIEGPQGGTGAQGLAGFINDQQTVVGSGDGSGAANGTIDLLAFYSSTGGTASFDLDASGFNGVLRLFNANGTQIGVANPGGTSDAVLTTNLPSSGLYYIGVYEGTGLSNGPDMGNTYTLELDVPGSDGFGVMSAGATSLTLPITVNDDSIVEATETIDIELTGKVLGLSGMTVDVGESDDANLTDDDSAFVNIVNGANAAEPSTNTTFTVTLTQPASTTTVVPFVVDAGATFASAVIAQYGADYTLSGPGVSINVPGVNVPGSYPGNDITGTVTFTPGQTTATITLNVINEDVVEDDETVTIALLDGPLPSTPAIIGDVDIALGTSIATNTIIDEDEALVTLNAVDGFLMEPTDSGYFRVTLIRPDSVPGNIVPVTSSVATTVQYNVLVSSTATPGSDYVALSGFVTIPANQPSADIDVTILDDLNLEPTESVTIELVDTVTRPIVGDSGVELDLTNTTDTVFIHDNDTLTVKIENVQNGGEAGPVNGQFLVSLQGDAGAIATYASSVSDPIVISYTVTGTASEGLDYASLSGTVVIPAGMTSEVIDINVIDDAFFDPNETVTITLDNIVSQPAVGLGGSGVSLDAMFSDTLDIVDDETGFVSITGYTPARESGQDGTLTFELAGASPNPIVINYAINTFDTDNDPGDSNTGRTLATQGSDHVLFNGTVTFLANQTSVTIPVPVLNDMALEGIEVIPVEITGFASSSFGYQINPNVSPLGLDFSSDSSRAELPILEDQTVDIVASSTGVEGIINAAFTVSIESPSGSDTVIDYSVIPNGVVGQVDAAATDDYTPLTGTVTILAGQTSALIVVPLVDDLVIEGTEYISIELDSVANATDPDITIGLNDTATAAILDNDAGFVNIEAINDGEEAGPVDGKFRVTLYEPSGAMATTSSTDTVVNYIVTGNAIPGTSATNSDYVDLVSMTYQVTIPAGQTFADIDVSIFDDNLIELDTESITITLDSVVAPPTDPQIGIGSVSGPNLTFGATQDTFLEAVATGAINGNEAFVNVDGPGVGEGENQGLLRFDNLFGAGSSLIPAGAEIGSATLGVNVTDSGNDVRLHEMLVDWNESTATWDLFVDGIDTDNSEASASALTNLLGNAGSVNVTASVQNWSDGQANYGWTLLYTGTDDLVFSSSETHSAPQLTVAIDVSATINIIDNDGGTVEITGVQAGTEPGGPLSNPTGFANAAVVTVSLPTPASTDTVVHYKVENGTAIGGSDYVGPSTGSVTILAGNTSADILIEVLDDTVSEGTENVTVTLTGLGTILQPVDADITLGTNITSDVDILDNEAGMISVASTMDGNENNLGSPIDGHFTITTDFVSDEDTIITYTITGTATNGGDYTTLTGTVTLPANLSQVVIPVEVIEDFVNEDVETVTMTLVSAVNAISSGSNLSIGTGNSATLEIADDDDLVIDIVATQTPAIEGAVDGEFQIQLNYESDEDVRVFFTVGGSANVATNDFISDDYAPLPGTAGSAPNFNSGSVVIPAGSTSFTLPVDVVQDFLNESSETVVVTLTGFQMLQPGTNSPGNNTNVSLGTTDDTVVIEDELFDVSIEKTDTPASENNLGTPTNGQFTVYITNDLPVDVTVLVQYLGTSTADLGTDFEFSNGSTSMFQSVTIPAFQTSATLDVEVLEDLLSEGLENIDVQIIGVQANSFPSTFNPLLGIDVANNAAQETIADDDGLTVSINAIDGTEPGFNPTGPALGDDGAFVFTQDYVSVSDTTITYSIVTAGTSAVAGNDYATIGTGSVVIPAGNLSNMVLLDVLNDSVVEGDETVQLKIDSVSTSGINSATGSGSASATIFDDDNATLTVVGTNNGEEPSNEGFFIVYQTLQADADTTFTYTVTVPAPDDATPGDDYVTLTGTATVLAGQTQVEIPVQTLEDNLIEDLEEVEITLTAVTGSSSGTTSGVTVGSPATAAINIVSDDTGLVTVVAGDDGKEGMTTGTFVVTLTTFDEFGIPTGGTSDQDTVINYVLSGVGTVPANANDTTAAFFPLIGQVTILAGQNTATINVPIVDDAIAEPTEGLQVTLLGIDLSTGGNNENYINVGSPNTATIDIFDNEVAALTVSDPTVNEDDGTVTVTVTLNVETQDGFTVDYATADDTAFENGTGTLTNDYTAANGTLTFAGNVGESYDIVIDITDGMTESTLAIDVVEATEQFKVVLSNLVPDSTLTPPVNIADQGVVTIEDDDTMTFSIGNVAVNETDGTLTFGVTASNPTDINVGLDVSYTTPSGDPANSPGFNTTDAKGQDFDDFGGPGEPPLPSDTDYDSGTDSVLFTAGDYNVPETVTVEIVDELAYGFPILVEGGLSNDPGWERFLANLDITTNSSTLEDRSLNDSDTAIGQIDDEDAANMADSATVILSVETVADGLASEPSDNGKFTVTQSQISSYDTVIAYTVESGNLTDATPGVDYVSLSGTVTIPAGQTTATIDVTVLDDATTLLEDDEFVRVTLDTLTSADPNISIDPASTTEQVKITDDDQGLVWIEANDPNAAEPADNGQFTVYQSELSDTDTVVQYVIATGPGNATNGADYVTLTGTVTIFAGSTSATIDVTVLDDSFAEAPENVTLTLTGFAPGLTNADLAIDGDGVNDQVNNPDNDTATVVIDGLDSNINVLVTQVTHGSEFNPADPNNDDEEPINGVFKVELRDDNGDPVAAPVGGVLVTYTVGGTADPLVGSGGDYTALPGILNIGSGQSVGFITVDVAEDSEVEPTETVTVTLDTASNNISFSQPPINTTGVYAVDSTTNTVNITDDDAAAVAGIYANGTAWAAEFRDRVDGTPDGSTFGYELTGRADQNETLPWVNVNQFIVEFDQAVDVASLGMSDFGLSLVPFSGFVPISGTLTAVGTAPNITSVVPGPSSNTVVVTLDAPISASKYVLDINAAGLTFGGAAGINSTYDFLSLPGDVVTSAASYLTVNALDSSDVVPRSLAFAQIFGATGAFGPYSFRADLDGNNVVNVDDVTSSIQLDLSLLSLPSPIVSFLGMETGIDSLSGSKSTVANHSQYSGVDSALAGAKERLSEPTSTRRDDVFGDLFDDGEKEAEIDFSLETYEGIARFDFKF